MNINQTAIETFPRPGLLRLVQFTTRQDLYEAARQELRRRDTDRLVLDWRNIMIGEDRVISTHVRPG